jgi:hypothetical protein
MNETIKLFLPEPAPTVPLPTTVDLTPATGTVVLDFNELKNNSVVVIKIAPKEMSQRMAATEQIATALRPFRDLIKSKNIAFIVMGIGETMETVDENQMNSVGWYKKEESRIILPH